MSTACETKSETRARLKRTFAEELYDTANAMLDLPDPTLRWVGGKIAELADRARFLGARSAGDFDDKTECMLASVYRK